MQSGRERDCGQAFGVLGVTLTPSKRQSVFDQPLVPSDPAFRKCPSCLYLSINEPRKNQAVRNYNKKVRLDNKKKLVVWQDYKERKAKATCEPDRPFFPITHKYFVCI